ncbi:TPA: tyrosine-type recombinase/integrase [Vibrio parahaemolyticus]|nr:tyrosine-type recombinase/integrase [Vibrio parahaemolyticus]
MSDVKLVKVTFSNLGNVKLRLVEVDNELETLSAGYLLQRYENGFKPDTIKKDAQGIQHLYRFCINQGINLHQLVASKSPLSMGDIEEYASFCSVNYASYCSPSKDTYELVSVDYYKQRMRISWAFIKWLWLFYQNRTKGKLDDLKAAQIQFAAMELGFKAYMKSPINTTISQKTGLSPELRNRFFGIINPLPENTQNPWKSQRVRWRNYALLLTMVLGGNRKGESLLLKLNHFSLSGNRKYFEILKSSDLDYPRSEAPSVKTLGREIELNSMMADIFEHYISVWRKEFKNAKKSMYMFLSSRDGLPLSVQTPNAILKQLINMYPEYEGVLSPHRLRNTFHDVLNDALNLMNAAESPLSRKLKKAPIQEYAGGWKRGSEMPNHYPKGSIQREVARMHFIIQDRILSTTEYAEAKRKEELDHSEAGFYEWMDN